MPGRRRTTGTDYDDAVLRWRTHKALRELAAPRKGQSTVLTPEVRLALLRDRLAYEKDPDDLRITTHGVVVLSRWGVDGPGAFPT